MTIIICSGRSVQTKTVAEMILEIMGCPVKLLVSAMPYQVSEMFYQLVIHELAQKLLSWQPTISLKKDL
jgi:nucleoside-diphosphate-sugar epimerase